MDKKQYKGAYNGLAYKVTNGYVLVSYDGTHWQHSQYGKDLALFQDGIDKGYLREVVE